MLLSLTSSSVCRADEDNEEAKQFGETIIVPMFPDGLKHDFGTVQRGPEYRRFVRRRMDAAQRSAFAFAMLSGVDTLLSRITINPSVCHGPPCVRGLRNPVERKRDSWQT